MRLRSLLLVSLFTLCFRWLVVLDCPAQSIQPVSIAATPSGPPAGGGGDSSSPILSSDGNFLLFASLAGNLVANPATNSQPNSIIPAIQVFLRNRTNGTTTLVSLNEAGNLAGNGDSLPVKISNDGRFALFESDASDLVPGDTNQARDIFVRDLFLGKTILVSLNTNGAAGNGTSRNPAMSAEGRFVAFASAARDLVPGDTNGLTDVFVRDLQNGTTILVTPSATSPQPSGLQGASDFPEITPDGQSVLFTSTATNLVAGGYTSGDIYVCNLISGLTTQVSANARTISLAVLGSTNIACYGQRISADGQFVAYEACVISPLPFGTGIVIRFNLQTGQTDLVSTNAAVIYPDNGDSRSIDLTTDGRFVSFLANTNGEPGLTTCVCRWDSQTGATTLVSGDLNGLVPSGTLCSSPSLDASGRFVGFLSNATNLTADPITPGFHLYRFDAAFAGVELVDKDLSGAGSIRLGSTTAFSMSNDGNQIAFEAPDGNLVSADHNRALDVFLRDLDNHSTELVSSHDPQLASLLPSRPAFLSASCISTNGRFVAFCSEAEDLVPNDTNGCRDIFVRDVVVGTNLLVSVASNGATTPNSLSTEPAISEDGRYVAFASFATNLVPGATSDHGDVYVRELATGNTTLVSVNKTGNGPGNRPSRSPWISSDGKYVLFKSRADNLLTNTVPSKESLFLRNLQTGTAAVLPSSSSGGSTIGAATPDGRYIAYSSGTFVYLWNTQTGTAVTYVSSMAGSLATGLAISPDGSKVVYSSGTQIRAIDIVTRSNWLISTATGTTSPYNRQGFKFSRDGRYFGYAGLGNVYLYDFQTFANLLVSHAYSSSNAGNGSSGSPDLSADGRFIVYQSQATNLVPGDANHVGDLFLYDRLSQGTTLITVSRAGAFPAGNWSMNAFFSGDGRTLVFQSWAADLVPGAYSQQANVFALSLNPDTNGPPTFSSTMLALTPATVAWPATPGHSYRLQFKHALSDAFWQDVPGGTATVGNQGFAQDPAPSPTMRFYRVVAY